MHLSVWGALILKIPGSSQTLLQEDQVWKLTSGSKSKSLLRGFRWGQQLGVPGHSTPSSLVEARKERGIFSLSGEWFNNERRVVPLRRGSLQNLGKAVQLLSSQRHWQTSTPRVFLFEWPLPPRLLGCAGMKGCPAVLMRAEGVSLRLQTGIWSWT